MKPVTEHIKALGLMESGDFESAREILAGLAGGGWIVRNDLALCEYMLGNFEAATELFEGLLADDPSNSFVFINRFYCLEAGLVKKAVAPDPLSKVLKTLGDGPQGPTVTVVMPTFNRPDMIVESIESVLAQSFEDWELIVVNDGGDRAVEGTMERYVKDGRIRYALAEHGGLSSARNVGMALARGRYITQLDDDDIFYPEHLATVMAAFEEDSKLKVVYTDFNRAYQELQGGEWVTVKREVDFSQDFSRDEFRSRNYIPVCNLTHHREALQTAGFYNERVLRAMDWDYFIRLSKLYDFRHVKKTTGEFRQRSDRSQMTRSFSIPRNYYRNLVSFLHGFFPLTGARFADSGQGSGERMKKALDRLIREDRDEFFLRRLELRKLISEPYYALFYTMGKRVSEEGDMPRARDCFRAAASIRPWEIKAWSRLFRP